MVFGNCIIKIINYTREGRIKIERIWSLGKYYMVN